MEKPLEEKNQERTNFLQAILEETTDIVFIKDLKGRYLLVNKVGARYFGKTPEEVVGQDNSILDFPPGTAKEIEETDRKVIRTGETLTYEVKLNIDGALRTFLSTKSPYRDHLGKVIGVIAISRDITDRKLAEETLRAEHAYRKPIEEAMLAGVAAADLTGKLIYVNPAFCKIVGWNEQDLLGQTPPFPFWPPEDIEKIKEIFKNRLSSENPPEIEIRFQRKNGERVPVFIKTAPLTDGYGNKIGIVSTIGDITNQKLSETKLRESHNLLKSIIEGTTDAVYLRDLEGRYLMINSSGARLFGKSPKDIIGRHISELFSPEFVRKTEAVDRMTLRSGKIETLENKVTINGMDRIFLTTRGPIRNHKNEISGFFGISRDITERKLAEEELQTSEERFRRYFDLGLIGMAITSPEKGCVEVNDELCNILGYQRNELLQKNWTELTHPDDLAADDVQFNRVMAGEIEGYSIDKRFIRKDGRVVPTTMAVNSVRRLDKSIEYFVALIQDITDRKQMEDELRGSNQMLTGLIQAAPVALLLLDPNGIVQMWNPEAERIFGWREEEVLGRFVPVIPADKQEEFRLNLAGVFQGKAISGMETRRQKKGGRPVEISIWTVALTDSRGNKRCLSIVADITEKIRLREELLKVQKLESLGVLAGGIAHDFNNILTAILGNISLGKSELNPNDWLYRRMTDAEKACLRATDLSRQLLTFAKGGAPIKRTVDIKDILEHSVQFALRGSNVRVELSFQQNLNPVDVDEAQIGQVIQNIAINAKQAMPAGGTVKVNARNITVGDEKIEGISLRKGRYVEISIQDTGIGIPEEMLPKIFDPYFTTKKEGSGLGLAISYSIIQKHEGYITVKSTPGVGTVFIFYLPVSSLSIAPTKKAEEVLIKGTGKILVVDDDVDILQVVGEMLRVLGYEVELATNGKEALQKYKKAQKNSQPVLTVITDLTMPGEMGGTELLQKLKAFDSHVKVIVSSGYSNEPVISDPKTYGFAASMVKPYQPADLGKTLQKVIQSEK